MPAKLDRCVSDLLKDPNFKPKKAGQSKESAAYAVCTASVMKKSLDDALGIIDQALSVLDKTKLE